MQLDLPYRLKLRDYQWPVWRAFFQEDKKRAVCVWHRRAGKDKTFLNILIGASQQRVGNYVYLFPEQRQARRAIWQGIDKNGMRFLDHFPPELLDGEPNKTEMLINFRNGWNASYRNSNCTSSKKQIIYKTSSRYLYLNSHSVM